MHHNHLIDNPKHNFNVQRKSFEFAPQYKEMPVFQCQDQAMIPSICNEERLVTMID